MQDYLANKVVDEIVSINMTCARHNLGQQTDAYEDMDATPVRGVDTGENYHVVEIAELMDKIIQNENASTDLSAYVNGLRGDAWKGLIQRILDEANEQLARQWQALKKAAINGYNNRLRYVHKAPTIVSLSAGYEDFLVIGRNKSICSLKWVQFNSDELPATIMRLEVFPDTLDAFLDDDELQSILRNCPIDIQPEEIKARIDNLH